MKTIQLTHNSARVSSLQSNVGSRRSMVKNRKLVFSVTASSAGRKGTRISLVPDFCALLMQGEAAIRHMYYLRFGANGRQRQDTAN